MTLQEHLAALRDAGVRTAKLQCTQDGTVTALEVEFEPIVPEGKVEDLDDGMPPLTHDPIAEKYAGNKA